MVVVSKNGSEAIQGGISDIRYEAIQVFKKQDLSQFSSVLSIHQAWKAPRTKNGRSV